MADAMTRGSAAQAAGLAEAAELPAPQGPLGAGADPGEEPGEMGLVLGKRHQRMFKASEDEFLLKYWVRCGWSAKSRCMVKASEILIPANLLGRVLSLSQGLADA